MADIPANHWAFPGTRPERAVPSGPPPSWLDLNAGHLAASLGGVSEWLVDKLAALHSAPGLGQAGTRGHPAGRTSMPAPCRPAWAVAVPEGCPAGRTCTLGTLPPVLFGEGARWVDPHDAGYSVPGRGCGRHRRAAWPADLNAGTSLPCLGGGGAQRVVQLGRHARRNFDAWPVG